MILFLRIFFLFVLASMLMVTCWASSEVALWKIPENLIRHPWFIATLFDTYWAFFTFYCWLFYRETRATARVLWFIGIICFGNIAMAGYMLKLLFRLPLGATARDILLRNDPS
jgi:hypothetical protein